MTEGSWLRVRPDLRRWLLGAVLVGALARLPGVAWGVNWPDGFTIHHPDEYTHVANADALITPFGPRTGVAYPKGMAAYAALPYLIWYAGQGSFGGPRVHLPWIVGAGRLVSVVFGLAPQSCSSSPSAVTRSVMKPPECSPHGCSRSADCT